MTWLEKILSRPKSFTYDDAKEVAVKGSTKERLSLANSADTHKEILFYLAENDPDAKVRQAVAKNKSTPMQAAGVLAVDDNVDVRMALAHQLVKLLPDLSEDTQSQLYAFAVQSLGTLALDEVLKVRKALTSTLKDHAFAPPAVAAQLARDIEREVAEPILRFCVALKDEDLIDILSEHPASWAAEAVASRPKISAPVSKAVIETGNGKAGTILLKNEGADINKEVLQSIIERAKEFPEWHEPLATNHKLPKEMAKQMARYVDSRVRKILQDKGNYDLETTEIVTDATRRRIGLDEEIGVAKLTPEQINRRIKKLHKEGHLTEEKIADALALRNKYFVIAALAMMVGSTPDEIEKAFSVRKPRVVCAVCWKAGLSMRFALRVQQELAGVPTKELIYPRGGSDYPMDPKDMQWQLEFLGIGI